MREAASRGFWIGQQLRPIGYNRLMVQDGAKKRPTLEPDPDASRVVKRIFDMAEAGNGDAGHHPHPRTTRASPAPHGKALVQEASTSSSETIVDLGRQRQGQGRPYTDREGVSRHHLQSQVPARQQPDALPRTGWRRSSQAQFPAESEAPTCSAGWSSATSATGRSADRTPRAASSPTTSASRS